MTGTWTTTLGAGLVAAALCVAPPPVVAQTPRQVPPLPPLPATQIDERLPSQAKPGRTFSLSFSEPQPIRDVLLLILKDTGLSVVIDPDVTGTFTGELANVTLPQALDITLAPLGLRYTLADNLLHVSRRPTETRFFDVDHVVTRRSSERTTSAPTGPSPPAPSGAGGSSLFRTAAVTSNDATDFHEELTRTVAALLSGDGSLTMDRKAGLLRVTDYPDRLDRVSHYLELAEMRVTRQVQIEATFVQVALDAAAAAGIDWNAVLQAAGDAVTPVGRASANTGGVFSLGLNVRNLDGLLKGLATQGVVNVVASPRVAVMNNEPAIVRAGTQRIVPDRSKRTDGKAHREGQNAAAREEPSDGVVLTVTPQISADRIVQMSVAPSVADSFGVRGADTIVRVRDGETVVIDGLMQARVRGGTPDARGRGEAAPGDGSRHVAPAARKTELVILLTATIVDRSR
jgi:type II secretory pathway component GspD/PulD (secretin)